jgi:hypothetical protein
MGVGIGKREKEFQCIVIPNTLTLLKAHLGLRLKYAKQSCRYYILDGEVHGKNSWDVAGPTH